MGFMSEFRTRRRVAALASHPVGRSPIGAHGLLIFSPGSFSPQSITTRSFPLPCVRLLVSETTHNDMEIEGFVSRPLAAQHASSTSVQTPWFTGCLGELCACGSTPHADLQLLA